jgi:hypothetical protein
MSKSCQARSIHLNQHLPSIELIRPCHLGSDLLETQILFQIQCPKCTFKRVPDHFNRMANC